MLHILLSSQKMCQNIQNTHLPWISPSLCSRPEQTALRGRLECPDGADRSLRFLTSNHIRDEMQGSSQNTQAHSRWWEYHGWLSFFCSSLRGIGNVDLILQFEVPCGWTKYKLVLIHQLDWVIVIVRCECNELLLIEDRLIWKFPSWLRCGPAPFTFSPQNRRSQT